MNGFQLDNSINKENLLVTSVAPSVPRHGCQLMPEKDTNKAAKIVIGITSPSIFGKMIFLISKRKRSLYRTMENRIEVIYVKHAKEEFAKYIKKMIEFKSISLFLLFYHYLIFVFFVGFSFLHPLIFTKNMQI